MEVCAETPSSSHQPDTLNNNYHLFNKMARAPLAEFKIPNVPRRIIYSSKLQMKRHRSWFRADILPPFKRSFRVVKVESVPRVTASGIAWSEAHGPPTRPRVSLSLAERIASCKLVRPVSCDYAVEHEPYVELAGNSAAGSVCPQTKAVLPDSCEISVTEANIIGLPAENITNHVEQSSAESINATVDCAINLVELSESGSDKAIFQPTSPDTLLRPEKGPITPVHHLSTDPIAGNVATSAMDTTARDAVDVSTTSTAMDSIFSSCFLESFLDKAMSEPLSLEQTLDVRSKPSPSTLNTDFFTEMGSLQIRVLNSLEARKAVETVQLLPPSRIQRRRKQPSMKLSLSSETASVSQRTKGFAWINKIRSAAASTTTTTSSSTHHKEQQQQLDVNDLGDSDRVDAGLKSKPFRQHAKKSFICAYDSAGVASARAEPQRPPVTSEPARESQPPKVITLPLMSDRPDDTEDTVSHLQQLYPKMNLATVTFPKSKLPLVRLPIPTYTIQDLSDSTDVESASGPDEGCGSGPKKKVLHLLKTPSSSLRFAARLPSRFYKRPNMLRKVPVLRVQPIPRKSGIVVTANSPPVKTPIRVVVRPFHTLNNTNRKEDLGFEENVCDKVISMLSPPKERMNVVDHEEVVTAAVDMHNYSFAPVINASEAQDNVIGISTKSRSEDAAVEFVQETKLQVPLHRGVVYVKSGPAQLNRYLVVDRRASVGQVLD